MKIKKTLKLILLSLLSLTTHNSFAAIPESKTFNHFIDRMVNKHGFEEETLRKRFVAVEIQQPILDAIAKPAETKPWFEYREIFMTEARIAGGVQFWLENEAVLQSIEHKYKVPAEILIAIIGVESNYGEQLGKYRVIDALSTLAFAYPPRSKYFQKELESFLLLSRKEHMDPMKPVGSYAGAMGLPQFMPSSFHDFAVDFNHDHKRDIWKNNADALASIGNYFAKNHWQHGAAIAFPVKAKGDAFRQIMNPELKPDTTVAELRNLQVDVPSQLAHTEKVKLMNFQQPNGEDLWIGLHNFYVITRYNHSPLYAMAVYQLSQAIVERKKSLDSPAELQK